MAREVPTLAVAEARLRLAQAEEQAAARRLEVSRAKQERLRPREADVAAALGSETERLRSEHTAAVRAVAAAKVDVQLALTRVADARSRLADREASLFRLQARLARARATQLQTGQDHADLAIVCDGRLEKVAESLPEYRQVLADALGCRLVQLPQALDALDEQLQDARL